MAKNILWYEAHVTKELLKNIKGLFSIHVLTLQEIRPEGENIKTFIFKPNHKVNFAAGQFGLWFIPRIVWGKPARLFTIAASPTEDTLQISTRIGPSSFKQQLSKLPIGSKVYMFGPFGEFTLGKQPPETAVLVAGGIGVTPMRSIARFAHDAHVPTKLICVHSAEGYYLYQNEMQSLGPDCYFVTKDTFAGVLSGIAKQVQVSTPFYLSGPPAFVTYAEGLLAEAGQHTTKHDGFLGY